MGKLIKFSTPVFVAIDSKVCSTDGTGCTTLMIDHSREAARKFCKKANAHKECNHG